MAVNNAVCGPTPKGTSATTIRLAARGPALMGSGFGEGEVVPIYYSDAIGQMGFVAAVVALQLWWSAWWLARYRFGPAEWVWRSLTYGKKQPMR